MIPLLIIISPITTKGSLIRMRLPLLPYALRLLTHSLQDPVIGTDPGPLCGFGKALEDELAGLS